MSVDINWEALTGGADGSALAEGIRSFVHDKFQQIPLPRFVRSVNVHAFEFGDVAPQIEIKDICDPLPDFYEEDSDDDEAADKAPRADRATERAAPSTNNAKGSSNMTFSAANDPYARQHESSRYNVLPAQLRSDASARGHMPGRNDSISTQQLLSPSFLSRASTPGIPGGTSNMSYFHMPFNNGLSGAATPLAAVAGAQFGGAWQDARQNGNNDGVSIPQGRPHAASVSSITPPSTADPSSRPTSQHMSNMELHEARAAMHETRHDDGIEDQDEFAEKKPYEPDFNDLQIITHVKYNGDVKLAMTASILLDYPMPSFVEIPVKLTITGLTFDGVAIIAYIRRKAHFCFLAPEDAESLLEGEEISADSINADGTTKHRSTGGLLEEIRVESEIGHKETGKQILKNVGKVEKFILEQVRRIFEEEFVYPSFWTFLV